MTISWQQVKQVTKPWGIEVFVEFIENSEPLFYKTFRFNTEQQITNQLTNRCVNSINRFEIKRSRLNRFGEYLGNPVAQKILIACIVAIRNSPNVTLTQAQAWFDNNYPEAIWKASVFLDEVRYFCKKELGFVPTWEQFKTYVINNKFQGADG